MVVRVRSALWRLTAVLAVAVAGCSIDAPVTSPPSMPVPPPAVSGTDHTVLVTLQLADSFDVLPNGLCTGRGENRGMRDGVRIRLHGNSTGLYDETLATARFQRRALSPKQSLIDDGLYCVLRAVFAPSLPDPDGYSISFPGTPVRWDH